MYLHKTQHVHSLSKAVSAFLCFLDLFLYPAFKSHSKLTFDDQLFEGGMKIMVETISTDHSAAEIIVYPENWNKETTTIFLKLNKLGRKWNCYEGKIVYPFQTVKLDFSFQNATQFPFFHLGEVKANNPFTQDLLVDAFGAWLETSLGRSIVESISE